MRILEMDNFGKLNIADGSNKNHYWCEFDSCLYKIYTHKHDKQGRVVNYLKCISNGCPTRAKIVNDFFSYTFNKNKGETIPQFHNHEDHRIKIEAESAYSELKNEVTISSRPIRQLYDEKMQL